MLQTLLTIDGHRYELSPEQDLDVLKAQLLDAANGGARFVELLVAGQGRCTVSVLVTPRVSVQLERREVDVLEPTADEHDLWPVELGLHDASPLGASTLPRSTGTGTDG
ncbi:hypothetical protein [Frigoribacterium salinisoli]